MSLGVKNEPKNLNFLKKNTLAEMKVGGFKNKRSVGLVIRERERSREFDRKDKK